MTTRVARSSPKLLVTWLLSITFLGSALCANAQQNSSSDVAAKSPFIGLKHGRDLPKGLKDNGGGLISDPYKDKIQFGITHVTRGNTNMLWFELGTHHDSSGQAFWEVLDVVTTPTPQRNQQLMFTLCTFNGKPDPEIAALIANPPRGSYVGRTLKAWRANRVTRRFEEISVKGVRCEIQGDD